MRKLIAGIVDFRERMLPQYAQRFKELALAQEPDALFITCVDSRVVPDLLASTLPGDLFTMRNDSSLKPHDQLSHLKFWFSSNTWMSYPIVRSRVLAGALRLSGWWFDVASGTMGAYDRDSRTFKIIDRQLTERFAP